MEQISRQHGQPRQEHPLERLARPWLALQQASWSQVGGLRAQVEFR